jgi:hypothetical protein
MRVRWCTWPALFEPLELESLTNANTRDHQNHELDFGVQQFRHLASKCGMQLLPIKRVSS